QAAEERRAATLRQATLNQLRAELEAQKAGRARRGAQSQEPTYGGQPLGKLLRNPKAPGTTLFTLDELMTVRQVSTGKEPDIATFELPILYDVATNIGALHLLVDAGPEPRNDVSSASSAEALSA